MEGDLNTYVTILGFVLFAVFFLGLVTYAFTRSWKLSVQTGLDSVRVKLRQLHTRLGEFRSSFQLFSPGDPEPFGPLVEAALDRLVGVEIVLRGLFDRYSAIHEEVSRLRLSRGRNFAQFPWIWYKMRSELVTFAEDIVRFEADFAELLNFQEQLSQLNYDVAKNCQSILQASNQVSAAFEKLHQLGLGGQSLESTRDEVRNWQATILNQVPVVFFSNDSAMIRSQIDKETTAKVYRLNQAAEPAINELISKVGRWKDDFQQYQEDSKKLNEGIPDIQAIIEELTHSPIFPITWEQTKSRMESLVHEVAALDELATKHDVDDLSVLALKSRKLYEELVSLSERLAEGRSDHMELCSLSFSDEMINGPETLKSAYQLVGLVAPYNIGNFLPGDALGTLLSDLNAIASFQGRYLRYSSASGIHENELSKRLELARNLMLQYRSTSPRLQNIRKRLAEIQQLEQSNLQKLGELKQVAEALDLLSQEENLPLRKAIGNEPAKIKSQIQVLSDELSRKETDTIDKKTERCLSIYGRVIKDLEKWTELISGEVNDAHQELTSQIGILREIVWIDDPVMADAEHLLSMMTPASVPGEEGSGQKNQLLHRFQNMVRSNEIYQRYSAIQERINAIAGPVLANYRQVEKSYNNVSGMMSKLSELFPQDQEAWPPTTIRVGNEKARFVQLEREWTSLKKDRMKAVTLADKLSGLLVEFKSIETQVEEGLSRVRQEQNRFNDYERRLDESRRMWKKVASNYQGNRLVGEGVEQLTAGVDQEVQRLRSRYQRGELNYSLALQAIKQICRKLDEGVVELNTSQIVDINGEVQRRI